MFVVGIGIVGENVVQWLVDFWVQVLVFGVLEIVNDGVVILLGVYGGVFGVIIVVGIGIIGLLLDLDGSCCVVDGWGFFSGDDGSGGWMGLCVLYYVQLVLDGCSYCGLLVDVVLDLCCKELFVNMVCDECVILLDWLV